ncbi:unnamed protein product [Closterium sp. NIES-53]
MSVVAAFADGNYVAADRPTSHTAPTARAPRTRGEKRKKGGKEASGLEAPGKKASGKKASGKKASGKSNPYIGSSSPTPVDDGEH